MHSSIGASLHAFDLKLCVLVNRGANLFPTAFIEYLTTDGSGEKAKKEALLAEFQKLEDYLAKHKADYFGGNDICSSKL